MYLLDTKICIYFMKNAYPSLTQKLLSLHPSDLMISSVTVFELEYGAAKSKWGERTRQKLAMFLAPFTILPFTPDDAIRAGAIRAQFEKQGTTIGPYDVQLAGQAISRKLVFVTHNTAEFNRIPNLMLEDWVI
ncbi:MAG: type II toxin-antitoxin system VapC family toxin [Solobacterium sp.]|nr:type II toxin-antitoxin system VapC family toxin [Solobacterium sp.]